MAQPSTSGRLLSAVEDEDVRGPLVTLGTPQNITDPAVFMEHVMKGVKAGRMLTYLVRFFTKDNSRARWFSEYYEDQQLYFKCGICNAVVDCGAKTWSKGAIKVLAAHGRIHFKEATEGKFNDQFE